MDHLELRLEAWAGGLSLETIGLQPIMKAMGVDRMAGETEWDREDKARCRSSGRSAPSFPDWVGPYSVSTPRSQRAAQPEAGRRAR